MMKANNTKKDGVIRRAAWPSRVSERFSSCKDTSDLRWKHKGEEHLGVLSDDENLSTSLPEAEAKLKYK
jgi:hypothetical protein